MKVRSPWIWTAWMLGVPTIVAISFAIPEALAMRDTEGLTLSQFTYTLFSQNLLLLVVVSFNAGGLFYGFWVHVFWRWTPRELRATCATCGRTILIEPLEIPK